MFTNAEPKLDLTPASAIIGLKLSWNFEIPAIRSDDTQPRLYHVRLVTFVLVVRERGGVKKQHASLQSLAVEVRNSAASGSLWNAE